jgi:TonB family protein
MFNNLIESNSHTREFKRRGSFFLFTIGAYALLFVVAGVVSIYAYDAHLDEQTTEFITMLRPVDFPSAPRDATPQPAHAPKSTNNPKNYDERQTAMLSVNHPPVVPPTNISTSPNPVLPLRDGHNYLITGRDRNGDSGGPVVATASGPSTGSATVVHMVDAPPAPPIVQRPVPAIVSKGVITGEATELPKPAYPALAKQTGTHGSVNVQVLIDENGRVISAHAVSGHPLLTPEAVKAAYRARFSPTRLGDQPVKVSGIITYNFLLNN